MAEIHLEVPSFRKAILYLLAGLGALFILVFLAGAFSAISEGINQETSPKGEPTAASNNFINNYEFSNTYEEDGGVRIFYTDDINPSIVGDFSDSVSSGNDSIEADFYLRKDRNDRYVVGAITIYQSTQELPSDYDESAQRWANSYSYYVFDNQTVVYRILDQNGGILKTYVEKYETN